MKRVPTLALRLSWIITGVAAVLSPTRALAGNVLNFFDHDVEVITDTDFTPEGRKMPPVSKEHPAYFEALILGYNDWGRSIAGEIVPEKKTMIRLIFKVLAEQGYLPCTPQHRPTMVIALAWGSMNNKSSTSLLFMGGDKLDLLWELDPYIGSGFDSRMLTRNARSGMADMILSASDGDLYVASIQAFDEAAAIKGNTVLLWHTKISCPADGLAMDTTLRQMIQMAAPMIGHETAKPVLTSAPEKNPTVEIGELKVLGAIDLEKMPITDRTIDDKAHPPANAKK